MCDSFRKNANDTSVGENDGPDGAGTSFLLFLQCGDNWLRRIRVKIDTQQVVEKGVRRDRESCWILSWAMTLEISARRRSDKPVKICK
jgi:hypothetical protein